VFIIEGASYDDVLDTFYGSGWTRTQPVLVINQLGVSPTMMGGGNAGPLPFSVNGRFQPAITMKPGEVQMWRIANTSPRGGVFVLGFAPAATPDALAPPPFKWKQIAQDGVQFRGSNYQSSNNPNLVIAAANRADLLVQAPPNTSGQPQTASSISRALPHPGARGSRHDDGRRGGAVHHGLFASVVVTSSRTMIAA
jgi:hypothetical protein